MEEKLTINPEEHKDYTLLKIEGRMDGYWSKQLEEYLDNALRTGIYNIALDLTDVNYMSSLGIRVLVKYKKLYRQVNGGFGVLKASKSVVDLLDMAGLNSVLRWQEPEITAVPEDTTRIVESEGFIYKISLSAGQKAMECFFSGDPGKIKSGGYTNDDCKTVSFGKNKYGIGLGAIGLNFEDCKNRFGEFVALGDSVVYSPAGKSNSPDYMLKSGSFIPRIEVLYGLIFEGDFNSVIGFSSDDPYKTMGMSQLINKLFEITGYEQFVMVMLAEASGLVGLSLNHSPAAELEADTNLFSFPAIKENINFTTEPEYKKMMTITAGIATRTGAGEIEKFTRPLSPGSPVHQHFHTAVFDYQPIKKTDINLDETITTFFEQDKIRGVLHLLNDTREINGIGESEFKGGVCWVGQINSPF
jgi:anti-anti-sigma factor